MKSIVQRKGLPVRMNDERFYLILLSVLTALTALIIIGLALDLHRNFLTIACDTAVLQSGLVNTLHGNWFANNGSGGPNILGSHTTFLLLLLVPAYVLIPSPDTLFVLQIWGVYSTVIPIYLVAGHLLRRPLVAFCVAAGALISPLLLQMAMAPFHLETWIAAAVFWSCLFYLRNNVPGFLASFLFAACCGEQATLIYIAFGAALLLVDDGLPWRKRYGRIALLAGFTWVILAVGVVTPLARGSHNFNIFAYNYAEWNVKSISGLPFAVAQNPFKAMLLVTNLYRWAHVLGIIGLPLLVALFSWRSFILLAPVPIYFLMNDQEFYLYFHAYYYSFAFFAGYLGVPLFLARREITDRLGIAVLAGLIFLNVFFLCTAAGFYLQLAAGRDEVFSNSLHQAFAKIPTEAGVYTPHRYSAYLSNRQDMVIGDLRVEPLDFNEMMNAQFQETNVHPAQIDYIVSDFMNDQCGWRGGNYNPDAFKARKDNVDRLLQSGQWLPFWGQSDVVILRRKGAK